MGAGGLWVGEEGELTSWVQDSDPGHYLPCLPAPPGWQLAWNGACR